MSAPSTQWKVRRTRLFNELYHTFSKMKFTENAEKKIYHFGIGHAYMQLKSGTEFYCDSEGYSVRVDAKGRPYRFRRPAELQDKLIRDLEDEMKTYTEIDWLKYELRWIFADRVRRRLSLVADGELHPKQHESKAEREARRNETLKDKTSQDSNIHHPLKDDKTSTACKETGTGSRNPPTKSKDTEGGFFEL